MQNCTKELTKKKKTLKKVRGSIQFKAEKRNPIRKRKLPIKAKNIRLGQYGEKGKENHWENGANVRLCIILLSRAARIALFIGYLVTQIELRLMWFFFPMPFPMPNYKSTQPNVCRNAPKIIKRAVLVRDALSRH